MGASLELLLGLGPMAIESWTLNLVATAADELVDGGFRVVSSRRDTEPSSILSLEVTVSSPIDWRMRAQGG